MYGRILVAIDGSETSDLALQEAIRLAKDQKAALRVLHVIDISPAYMTVETPYPFVEYQKALQEMGGKLLANRVAKARGARVKVDSKLIAIAMYGGRIYDVIEEQAKKWPKSRFPAPIRAGSWLIDRRLKSRIYSQHAIMQRLRRAPLSPPPR